MANLHSLLTRKGLLQRISANKRMIQGRAKLTFPVGITTRRVTHAACLCTVDVKEMETGSTQKLYVKVDVKGSQF